MVLSTLQTQEHQYALEDEKHDDFSPTPHAEASGRLRARYGQESQIKMKHFFQAIPNAVGSKKNGAANEDFTKTDKELADRKLTEWIVNHCQSFSAVEQEDFREFCSTLREQYDVPSRNTIKTRSQTLQGGEGEDQDAAAERAGREALWHHY
jgi:hypothetical protein